MVYEFRLPDIGEGVAEGEVVRWFVKEGETVREDAPLVSVLTDKANVEIPSPRGGRVVRLHAQVGEKVKVGGLLVTIDAGDGSPPSAPTGAASTTPAPASPSAPPAEPTAAPAPVPAPAAGAPSALPAAASRVIATPAVRRLANERGVDLAQVPGSGPGGRVTESDVLAAAGAVPAPAIPGEAPARAPPPTAPAPVGPPAAPPTAEPSAAGSPAGLPPASAGDVERIPIRGIRRVIFDHMAIATRTAAHFTYVEEVDATELVRVRDHMAKHVERQGVRLSYLPFVVKAVIAGLRAHPTMNATMDDARQELVVHRGYHIGIAAAAPDGLIVPVLRHAERKSVAGLAREIQDLADRGKAGKLGRAELTGGTFTITSLGALGGLLATPILNYPEVGILGVHKIARRAVVRPDGTIGAAEMMNLSVSLDHRVLDGIVGAQFLAIVKANLEDPHQLFADLA